MSREHHADAIERERRERAAGKDQDGEALLTREQGAAALAALVEEREPKLGERSDPPVTLTARDRARTQGRLF